MLKGVLFDMDGVLVDSEEFICQAAVRMFAEKGLRVKEEELSRADWICENLASYPFEAINW